MKKATSHSALTVAGLAPRKIHADGDLVEAANEFPSLCDEVDPW